MGQVQFIDSLGSQRETDQAAGMLGHEIDGLGGDLLAGYDEVALVFTVFVIDEDDEFPRLDIPNCVFDAVKGRSH